MKKISLKVIFITTLFLLSTIQLKAQTQIGQNILATPNTGVEPNPNPLGKAISISADGSRLAIGNRGSDTNSNGRGKVKVYEFNGTSWVQLGGDIVGSATSLAFGWAVSLSDNGNRLAISDPSYQKIEPHRTLVTGQVKVYELQGNNWVPLGNNIIGKGYMDWAGRSISLSGDGNTLAVKTRGYDGSKRKYEGSVQVYKLNGTIWEQVGADISGKPYSTNFFFGNTNSSTNATELSLNSDGTKLAIGTYKNDEPGKKDVGRVSMYEFLGTTWNKTGEFVGDKTNDFFGRSVSLSDDGNTVVVGAPLYGVERNKVNRFGYVKVYKYNGTSWDLKGSIQSNISKDGFGASVSISANGNTIAIGADGYNGYTSIYNWNGANWVISGTNISVNSAHLGFSATSAVSLDANGEKVAIGMAPYYTSGPPKKNTGLVQVYNIATNQNPVAQIKNGITLYLDASNNASISPVNMDDGSYDPDGDPLTFSLSQTSFDCSNIGSNFVTLTVSDGKGGEDTATGIIQIEEPTIIINNNCPLDITEVAAYGTTNKVITYTPPSGTTNCMTALIVTQTSGLTSGAAFPIGVTTNVFTIDDGYGNEESCSFDVTVNRPPNVSVVAGDLIYNDKAGVDDDIKITIDGPNYRLSSSFIGHLSAGAGATQAGNDVLVPIASITKTTGEIKINTEDGNDRLTINFDGGFYSHAIIYDGGNPTTKPGDSLEFDGSVAITTIAYTALNANSGTVAILGNSLITYTGLEPIIDNLTADHRVFNYTGINETITLDKGDVQDTNKIDSDFSELVEFKNPGKSLTINSKNGNGVNTINVKNISYSFAADLTINGGTNDIVTVKRDHCKSDESNLVIKGKQVDYNSYYVGTGEASFKIEAESLVNLNGFIQTYNGDIIISVNNPSKDDKDKGIHKHSGLLINTTGKGKILIGENEQ